MEGEKEVAETMGWVCVCGGAITVSLDDKAVLINPYESALQLISISVYVSMHAISKCMCVYVYIL